MTQLLIVSGLGVLFTVDVPLLLDVVITTGPPSVPRHSDAEGALDQ
jgi:hypothetical protein